LKDPFTDRLPEQRGPVQLYEPLLYYIGIRVRDSAFVCACACVSCVCPVAYPYKVRKVRTHPLWKFKCVGIL